MSVPLGTTLPPELLERLQGPVQAWQDEAFFLTTVDRRGRPHAALLSYAEAWAPDSNHVRIALYTDSGTADNLRVRGVTTLLLVGTGSAHYVKGVAREVEGGLPAHPGWAQFEVEVEHVLQDATRVDLEDSARLVGSLSLRRSRPCVPLRDALQRA